MYIFDFINIKKWKKFLILFIFIINYVFISYKDMGVLFDYKLKILKIYNTKKDIEYLKEKNEFIQKYLNRVRKENFNDK